MLYHFQFIRHWIIMTLKRSLKVIHTGTIRKLGVVSYSPSILSIALSLTIYIDLLKYGCILHQFRDKAWYWLKIMIFSYPLAFDAPVRGSPSEYCHPVWYGKTRMVRLPDGEKPLLLLLLLNEYYLHAVKQKSCKSMLQTWNKNVSG